MGKTIVFYKIRHKYQMAKSKKTQVTCRTCKRKFDTKRGLAIHSRSHRQGGIVPATSVKPSEATVSTDNLKQYFTNAADVFKKLFGTNHPSANLPKRLSLKTLSKHTLDLLDSIDQKGLVKSTFPDHYAALDKSRKGGALPVAVAAALPFVASAVAKYLPQIITGIKRGLSSDSTAEGESTAQGGGLAVSPGIAPGIFTPISGPIYGTGLSDRPPSW